MQWKSMLAAFLALISIVIVTAAVRRNNVIRIKFAHRANLARRISIKKCCSKFPRSCNVTTTTMETTSKPDINNKKTTKLSGIAATASSAPKMTSGGVTDENAQPDNTIGIGNPIADSTSVSDLQEILTETSISSGDTTTTLGTTTNSIPASSNADSLASTTRATNLDAPTTTFSDATARTTTIFLSGSRPTGSTSKQIVTIALDATTTTIKDARATTTTILLSGAPTTASISSTPIVTTALGASTSTTNTIPTTPTTTTIPGTLSTTTTSNSSTTTTTKPLCVNNTCDTQTTAVGCPFPQCPTLPCLEEAAKVTASKNWQSNADGVFRSACGRQYFISKLGLTWANAMTECCKYGMELLSIESFEELSCLAAMNKVQFKNADHFYWTSGTNIGLGCEFTYAFCASKTLLYQNFSNWSPGQPDNRLTEQCLETKIAFDAKQIIFNDQGCTNGRYFICEGEQKDCSPTCPSKSTCVKQNNLFNLKGELLNAFSYGRWATGSAKTYLFSTMSGVNWATAYTACCNLGMDFLSIASDQEMQDIFNLNNNDPLLRYNTDFWTSGTQLDCNFHFKYCSTGVDFYWNDTKWLSGEPENMNEQQWCVFSRFGTASTYSKSAAYLADAPCTESRNYICQMPALPSSSVTCFDYNCTTDPAKSAQVTAMSGSDGQFKTFCNQTYFLHKDSMSYKNAYDTCCSFGMKLVSVETDTERVCLHDGFKSAGWPGGFIWTSGTDVGIGSVNKFGWCPDGQFLYSNPRWCGGEPSSPYVENCLVLIMNGGDPSSTCFNDNNCATSFRFVCEA